MLYMRMNSEYVDHNVILIGWRCHVWQIGIIIGMTRVLAISFIRKGMDVSFLVRRALVTRREEKFLRFPERHCQVGDVSDSANMVFICMCGSNELITNT
jgi:hypothetical protein